MLFVPNLTFYDKIIIEDDEKEEVLKKKNIRAISGRFGWQVDIVFERKKKKVWQHTNREG